MKKLMTIYVLIAFASLNANADINLNFTEVDVGPSSQVDLTNQFAAYGVTFDHVYRYFDSRDPWKENGPQNPAQSPPLVGYGISNGWVVDNTISNILGTVYFTNPTPYVDIDWWTITGTLNVDAYDSGNNLIDSFSGSGSGTVTISGLGNISYMTFNDSGGHVQIANMTYVPVPGAVLLGILGLSVAGVKLRKFS